MIKINIPRPMPGTDENKNHIEFIEPLRLEKLVEVSSAYNFNYGQYVNGWECSYSPGFKYLFEFKNEKDATAFKLKFGGEIVE